MEIESSIFCGKVEDQPDRRFANKLSTEPEQEQGAQAFLNFAERPY